MRTRTGAEQLEDREFVEGLQGMASSIACEDIVTTLHNALACTIETLALDSAKVSEGKLGDAMLEINALKVQIERLTEGVLSGPE